MFETYQQADYLLEPRIAHWMESWCQTLVVMYVKNSVSLG